MKKKLFRLLMVSGLSFVVNLGLTISLHEWLGVPERGSFAMALACVFAMNFLLLRYYIYDGGEGPFFRQLGGYALSAGMFRLLEYGVFLLLLGWLELDYRLVVIGVLTTSTLLKFVVYRRVFEGRS